MATVMFALLPSKLSTSICTDFSSYPPSCGPVAKPCACSVFTMPGAAEVSRPRLPTAVRAGRRRQRHEALARAHADLQGVGAGRKVLLPSL